MPFITDTAMQKVATKLQSFETREEKRKIEGRRVLGIPGALDLDDHAPVSKCLGADRLY